MAASRTIYRIGIVRNIPMDGIINHVILSRSDHNAARILQRASRRNFAPAAGVNPPPLGVCWRWRRLLRSISGTWPWDRSPDGREGAT
jgi:hypothetical protein